MINNYVKMRIMPPPVKKKYSREHLAYLGVWALTSTYDYSWVGCFRCGRWLFGGTLRAIGDSCAMGVIDACRAADVWNFSLATSGEEEK